MTEYPKDHGRENKDVEDSGRHDAVTGTLPTGRKPAVRWMRFLARVISGLWAGFWIFFAVASSAHGFNTRGDASLGGLLIPLAFTILLLILALTAWRWEKIGRTVLPLAGLAVLITYPFVARHFPLSTKVFVMVTLGLPPLSAGILLIASGRIGSASGIPERPGT